MAVFVKAHRKKDGTLVRSYSRSALLTAKRAYKKAAGLQPKLDAQIASLREITALPDQGGNKGFTRADKNHPRYPRLNTVAGRSSAVYKAQVNSWAKFQKKFNRSKGKSPSRAVKVRESSNRAWRILQRAISR